MDKKMQALLQGIGDKLDVIENRGDEVIRTHAAVAREELRALTDLLKPAAPPAAPVAAAKKKRAK